MCFLTFLRNLERSLNLSVPTSGYTSGSPWEVFLKTGITLYLQACQATVYITLLSDCDVLLNLRKKGSNFSLLISETIGPAASQDVIKVKYLKVQHTLAKKGAMYDCTR